MKDYKRLTFKILVDPYDDDCEETENAAAASYDDLLNRLAKLEDKIENGTLVELPCKEGDIVYFVNWHRHPPRIEAFKVDHLEVNKNYIRVACYDFENEYDYSMYRIDSKDISFTKDEALKKLKELKRNT
mgnify:FL=1